VGTGKRRKEKWKKIVRLIVELEELQNKEDSNRFSSEREKPCQTGKC
jgi:hypothetical protein